MFYLPLISRGTARCKHATLDTTSSQVVQNSVIRHDQHASIIFVRRVPVKNALTKKHRQGRRRCEGTGNSLSSLEVLVVRVIVVVKIEQKLRNLVRVGGSWHVSDRLSRVFVWSLLLRWIGHGCRSGYRRLTFAFWSHFFQSRCKVRVCSGRLIRRAIGQRSHSGTLRLICSASCSRYRHRLSRSGWLLLVLCLGRKRRHNLNIVDEYIGPVNSCRELIRCGHFAIDQKFDMVRARP